MSVHFSLNLAWSQISVFDAGLTDPFNDWTDRHFKQGFTWRPGSVSFRTHGEEGPIDVSVDLVPGLALDRIAKRAIVVPFFSWGGLIEISTTTQSEFIDVEPGRYAMLYQAGLRADGRPWCSFGLMNSPVMPVHPLILRADEGILTPDRLLMEAEPAA